MDVPVALGITLAFLGSVWTTIHFEQGHVYYDSIAMFVFFLLTGRYFELIARQRSAQAAENLVQLIPTMATRLRQTSTGIQEELVPVAELTIGDTVLIRPGESIPADGLILQGNSSVDESLLTGESCPIQKQSQQTVIAGSVNIDNPLQVRIEKIGADTVLSHILRLLERAQNEKPVITQLADRIASRFILGILGLATAVAIYWWYINPTIWLTITLAVLVVTCPCALSLATPTAVTAATSRLTQIGLLTTRGHALETLARATHFVFDKTGTLTIGRLRLLTIHPFAAATATHCLQQAATLERYSEHPIALALREAYEQASKQPLPTATEVNNYPGAGIEGKILDNHYFLGTPAFIMEKTGLTLKPQLLQTLQQDGNTLVLLADRQTIWNAFLLGDDIRPSALELIQALKQQGKAITLLSGDHLAAVQRVAQTVGIETFSAALTPEEKLKYIKTLQNKGEIVAMLGDGINDAPVLAQAQVSIAMGSGTQIARASADMILFAGQLSHLITGIQVARQMLRIIRQNVIWAIGYNLLALPLAAMGLVAPWLAAIGMSLSSLLVVINALRLLN
jgi:Cu2+-exporting ATPase